MKYRQLTPQELEAYNIGYKVGNRELIITDIEWESENEHKIYRKGYMAGLMDYKRNVSNVSNVSNVDIATPTTSITPTTPIGIGISTRNGIRNEEKGGVGEKETKPLNNQSLFSIGGDDWKFSPERLKLAKKQWSNSLIRQIESDYSHRPPTEITIEKLLEEYPSDKVPYKILGEKKSIPLTQKQWEWFAKQGIAPAVKVKAIDLLEEYAVSNPKRFKQYSDLSIIIGRGWAYREAFKEPYKFENQEHMVAELQRVGLR